MVFCGRLFSFSDTFWPRLSIDESPDDSLSSRFQAFLLRKFLLSGSCGVRDNVLADEKLDSAGLKLGFYF